MSKHAYEKGVVIIKCDGCNSMHLIADHLGWYEHGKPAGTIEDILANQGESSSIRKLKLPYKKLENEQNGMTEYVPHDDCGNR